MLHCFLVVRNGHGLPGPASIHDASLIGSDTARFLIGRSLSMRGSRRTSNEVAMTSRCSQHRPQFSQGLCSMAGCPLIVCVRQLIIARCMVIVGL